jgi:GNAT superfamily N-acetyltransferase
MPDPLKDGYFAVPAGKIASVVTLLEMTERPVLRPINGAEGLTLQRVASPDPAWYRGLFERVGRDLLWFSRLRMPEAELAAILASPDVEISVLSRDGVAEGLLELDFREPGQCELAFFGVTPALVGSGAGRLMMNAAIAQAFARPIRRFWLHTCTFDHPNALPFYIRSGFRPFERQIEIADDPRFTGDMPESAAPQVPVISS